MADGTDNHLILVDVKTGCGLTGKEAEKLLDEIHITVNKNTIPRIASINGMILDIIVHLPTFFHPLLVNPL